MQLMDCHLEDEKFSRDQQKKTLRETLIFDETEVSSAALQVDALKNAGVTPPKKHIDKRAYDSEELVRYMSNLPSYLERGKEKAFNVGVLDWDRLERWQKEFNQIPCRNTSSSSSVERSSSISCTGQPSMYMSKISPKPPRGMNLESNKPNTIRENAEGTKARNPSPTRRFSLAISGKRWSSNTKDISKAESRQERVEVGSSLDPTYENCRGKSSPLRRLLDPLVKPRKSTSEVDSTSRDRRSKSAPRQVESPTSRFMKVKLDMKGCKTVEIDDGCSAAKHRPSRMQALFQVSLKNGVPLFKFAVETEGDILAATMKKNDWIYSFCTIREMKKKVGNWGNQGGKDKTHGYISSIVAQMKVSSCQSSIREFVLFPAEIKESGQPSHELAAIVVTGSREDISMSVILPGGNHGLPGKGEPSPLIERWKSGGSCDCGGWDLGCKLKVLANHSTTARFELFYQGEDQEDKPVLSFSGFKDGIFSVEYSSSLTLLQAFSICIAIWDVRKPYAIREVNSLCG